MSIKFKQNGQWVKIPTPSQIDDSAASAATTYSSNKINEIIPQDIAKYLLEHKDELGTDDFTKLKNVPFTTITNENATNYNTLDKLCHLDDGLYLCKDNYKTNQDYIVDITFKGMDVIKFVGDMYSGTESTPESTTVRCKNGCLISVSSITSIHKNIRITQSAEETNSNADDGLFGDIYISAKSDDGSTAENPVYGVTGDSVNYIRPFTFTSVLNTYFPAAVLSNAFGSESQNLNGKLAKWEISGQGVVLTGADIKESPIIEVNDSNWSNFDTLQKWMNASAGTYLVKTTKLTVSAVGVDKTKSSDNSFSSTLSIPFDTYVYVYSTDDSNSSATNYKNVIFQKADSVPTGYYGEWMTFKWDSRKTYSADNVELYPLMTAAMNGAASVAMVNELSSVVDTKVDAEYVTNATKSLATKQSVLDVKDLANRQQKIVLNVLGSTDDSAKILPKLNTTDKSNIVAAINELDARHDKFQENESTSVVLNNHTEYRCKVMASLNLSLPETIPDDYNSRIIFESGETATTLSYTAGSIKFTGDDCDSSDALVPATNTSYEVDIKYLGLDSSGNKRIVARVGAF